MPVLNLPDADLYYELHESPVVGVSDVSANRPALMLIAGLASDSQSWLPTVVQTLSQDRAVVVLDNRGSGRTEYQGEISIPQMASDCMALADHLNLGSVDLLGHSMGGMIALTAARDFSDRINRLVLCNSSAKQSARNRQLFDDWASAYAIEGPTEAWYRNLFYWLLTPEFFEHPHAINELVAMVRAYPYASSPQAYRAQGNAIAGFDASDWLGEIHTPTLVLAAKGDLIFPPNDNAAGLSALANAEVNVFEGQSHSMPMLAPALVLESVIPFLSPSVTAKPAQ